MCVKGTRPVPHERPSQDNLSFVFIILQQKRVRKRRLKQSTLFPLEQCRRMLAF